MMWLGDRVDRKNSNYYTLENYIRNPFQYTFYARLSLPYHHPSPHMRSPQHLQHRNILHRLLSHMPVITRQLIQRIRFGIFRSSHRLYRLRECVRFRPSNNMIGPSFAQGHPVGFPIHFTFQQRVGDVCIEIGIGDGVVGR